MKSCFIETYGCQMNRAESAAMELVLFEAGWSLLAKPEEASLIIINTCSVRETAETRALGRIDHYVAEKRRRKIESKSPLSLLVVGCMAERIGSELLERGADYVLGTQARTHFSELLSALSSGQVWEPSDEPVAFSFSSQHHRANTASALVPVMHGCNKFCTYCIVPYVRGREVSRAPKEVLKEISLLLENGVREITLLGQNVNSYTFREGGEHYDFPHLLDMVAREMGEGTWLRFLSSHPKDYSEALTETIARHKNIPRYLHLCVQHGSNRILKAMNRRYTRESYLEKIRQISKLIPEMRFSTDILIGFPGESEEDVQLTLDLMEEVRFSNAYMYHYNPREGTAAYDMPDRIPYKVKTERLERIIATQLRHSKERMEESLGKEEMVLVEGPSRRNPKEFLARSSRDEMVVYTGSSGDIGSFKRLYLEQLRGKTFRAKEIEICDSA